MNQLQLSSPSLTGSIFPIVKKSNRKEDMEEKKGSFWSTVAEMEDAHKRGRSNPYKPYGADCIYVEKLMLNIDA